MHCCGIDELVKDPSPDIWVGNDPFPSRYVLLARLKLWLDQEDAHAVLSHQIRKVAKQTRCGDKGQIGNDDVKTRLALVLLREAVRGNGANIGLLVYINIGVSSESVMELTGSNINSDYRVSASLQQAIGEACLLYTSPSPRDRQKSRMPSSA